MLWVDNKSSSNYVLPIKEAGFSYLKKKKKKQYKTKNKVFLNQLHFQEVSCAVRQFARNTWLIVAHTERKATLLYMLPNLDRKGQSNSPSPPGKFPALPLKS